VKGAVSVGLQNIVFSRKLKHHYGVQLAAPYVESKHAGKTSYIDPFSGDKYCTDHVEWFAAKVSNKLTLQLSDDSWAEKLLQG